MSAAGNWTPSPTIQYGVATHSFNPILNSSSSNNNNNSNQDSNNNGAGGGSELLNPHQVPLEIGDEVYVFEIFTPTPLPSSSSTSTSSSTANVQNSDEGIWYRGYVVTSASLQSELAYTTPTTSSSSTRAGTRFPNSLSATLSTSGSTPSSSSLLNGDGEELMLIPNLNGLDLNLEGELEGGNEQGREKEYRLKEIEPIVSIGIFPKSHIQLREILEEDNSNLERRLIGSTDLYYENQGDGEGGNTIYEEPEEEEEEVEIGLAREVQTGRNNTNNSNSRGGIMEPVSEELEDSGTGSGDSEVTTTTRVGSPPRLPKSKLRISTINLSPITTSLPSNPSNPSTTRTSTSRPKLQTRTNSSSSTTTQSARFSMTSSISPPSPRTPSSEYGVKSLDQSGMIDNKPNPPIPNLKSGDETISGIEEPLIDEIACTLREWSNLLHSHLFNKNYLLFASIRNHIEILHIGRRQLLASSFSFNLSLSIEEKLNLRRNLVNRLVRGNREQGLDVIVRHPNWGALVEGDGEALEEGDRKSWVSGVRMYAMQVALAYSGAPTSIEKGLTSIPNSSNYSNLIIDSNSNSNSNSLLPSTSTTGNGSNSRFSTPNILTSLSTLSPPTSNSIPTTISNPINSSSSSSSTEPAPGAGGGGGAKFHHIFLDLKAFVANICSTGAGEGGEGQGQGETVELYFSLFNKTESRYVTDEFCAILNSFGVSATSRGGGGGGEDLNSSVGSNSTIGVGIEDETQRERGGERGGKNGNGRGGRLSTIFTGFSSHDVLDEIFLVCRIVKNSSIRMLNENGNGPSLLTKSSNSQLSTQSSTQSSTSPTSNSNSNITSPTLTSSSSKFGTNSFESLVSETGVDLEMGNGSSTNNGMHTVDSNGRQSWRRPFGVAVLEISQFTNLSTTGQGDNEDLSTSTSGGIRSVNNSNNNSSQKDQEFQMPIFIPVNEASFSTLHEDIINSRIKEIEKSPKAQHVAVNIKILYGEINQILKENSMLNTGSGNHGSSSSNNSIPLTPRLGFEDVVFPGTERNDVYLKLWSGDFNSISGNVISKKGFASGLTSGIQNKNVEVSVEIRTRDGALVERVISRGTGEGNVTQYHSMVFRANNNPTWGELVKLDIPVELIESCHAFFSFRSRGIKEKNSTSPGSTIETPFAFAYFPLFLDNTAFMPDGSHKLILYKYDKSCTIPSIYFQAPAILNSNQLITNLKLPINLNKILIPIKDSLVLRSFLVSTTYTQNETLLKLLQWEKVLVGDGKELREVLTQLRFWSEVEVCKFLRDIFDALFNILLSQENVRGDIDDLVFHALISILGIVQDRRFTNFKPVLDVYIEHHFSSTTAYSHLMKALYRLLRDPGGAEVGITLRSSLKVMNNIFAIILRSRELQGLEETRIGRSSISIQANFKRELSRLLKSVNNLMQGPFPSSVIGAQTIAVHHFASILPDLAKCYNDQELAEIAISFGDSVSEKGKIQIYKLLFLNQLVNSKLFISPTARAALIPRLIRWLKPALGRFDERIMCNQNDTPAMRDSARVSWIEGIRLAVGVIAVILDTLQEALIDPLIRENRLLLEQEHDNLEYILGIIPGLLDSYLELQSPVNLESVERQRTQASIVSSVPVVFPSTYPFSLLARNPISGKINLGRRSSTATTMAMEEVVEEERPTLKSGLGEIACVFLVLISQAPRKIFVNYLEGSLEVEGKQNFAKQLNQIFIITKSILSNDAFPTNWLNINIFAHRVSINMLDPIAEILEREFIPVQALQSSTFSFNTSLWSEFFITLLKLVGSPQLLIEDFSPQKRRAVWRLGDDIRGRGAKILTQLWTAIGSPEDQLPDDNHPVGRFQIQFVPSLVEEVLRLCFSHHDELRTSAVFVLYSMIVSEYHLKGNFLSIEAEVINRLDKLFMQRTKGDEVSRAFFVGQLRNFAEESSNTDLNLKIQVEAFLTSINSFLDLLLAILNLPLGDEFQEDRIVNTLKLMNFVRGIGRSEIYIRYVDKLVAFHVASGDEVEAALTMKLHADLHEWNLTTFVDAIPDLDLPRQTDFARKETLYMRILNHLGKGQAYETAISICKELQIEYETKSFSYTRLSELLVLQSELYSKIVTSERQFGDYFRVAFYGNGFPASISGKQFVHRAAIGMKLGPFIENMLNKHPGAQLLRTSTIPSDEIQYSDGQHLQITSVTPEPDQESTLFTNPEVPHAVRDYYLRNETHTLSFTRSINRGLPGDTSYLSTWTEKTTLTCEDSFPTILRRSEVLEINISNISPIENALIDVESKTRELTGLEHRYRSLGKAQSQSSEKKVNTNVLSMALNGIVDTPIDKGIPMYRSVFLESDYLLNNPGQGTIVHTLAKSIDDLILTIARCLNLHGILCPKEMQPFHDTLSNFFARNFAYEIARLPTETRNVSFSNASSHPHPQFPKSFALNTLSRRPSLGPPINFATSVEFNPNPNYNYDFNPVRKDSVVSLGSNHTITANVPAFTSIDVIASTTPTTPITIPVTRESPVSNGKNVNVSRNILPPASPSPSQSSKMSSLSRKESDLSPSKSSRKGSPSNQGSISEGTSKSTRKSVLGSLRWNKKKDSIQGGI